MIKNLERLRIYPAKVIKIKKSKVVVNANLKCLYNVKINDFDLDWNDIASLIDKEIYIYISNIDPLINTTRIASYKKAMQEILWVKIAQYKAQKKIIEGKILSSTKGGYSVLLSELNINAFLPVSHIVDVNVEDLVGSKKDFVIIGINKLHNNLIISSKEVTMMEVENDNKDKVDRMVVGSVLKCMIKSITYSCIYVLVGNDYVGVISAAEATYEHEPNLFEMFSNKACVSAAILSINSADKKLVLSINYLNKNVFQKYKKGVEINVKFSRIMSNEDSTFTVIAKTEADGIMCKISKENNRYTEAECLALIDSGKYITATVKSCNVEQKLIYLTTKRSMVTKWNNFYSAYVKSQDKIMRFVVHNKSHYMIFLRYDDFECVMPIIFLSYNQTMSKFTDVKKGDVMNLYTLFVNKKKNTVVCSVRPMLSEIPSIISSLRLKKIVSCKLVYKLGDKSFVVCMENCFETIVRTVRINEEIQAIVDKEDTETEFNLEILAYNKLTCMFELAAPRRVEVPSGSSQQSAIEDESLMSIADTGDGDTEQQQIFDEIIAALDVKSSEEPSNDVLETPAIETTETNVEKTESEKHPEPETDPDNDSSASA